MPKSLPVRPAFQIVIDGMSVTEVQGEHGTLELITPTWLLDGPLKLVLWLDEDDAPVLLTRHDGDDPTPYEQLVTDESTPKGE